MSLQKVANFCLNIFFILIGNKKQKKDTFILDFNDKKI